MGINMFSLPVSFAVGNRYPPLFSPDLVTPAFAVVQRWIFFGVSVMCFVFFTDEAFVLSPVFCINGNRGFNR